MKCHHSHIISNMMFSHLKNIGIFVSKSMVGGVFSEKRIMLAHNIFRSVFYFYFFHQNDAIVATRNGEEMTRIILGMKRAGHSIIFILLT